MALQEAVCASLKGITETTDPVKLKEAYQAITDNLSNQSTFRSGLEALVICAETALKARNLDVAKKCLETYFLEARRYGAGLQQPELRDQYLCRAHYALGILVAEQAAAFKGQPLVDATLEAVRHVMKGMELAASNPRYSFLVYNGSVHYWHVSRPLQRDKMRHHLLPTTDKVVQLLDKVPGHEEWKVRNLMCLATCQAEGQGGKLDEAGKTLQRAYDLAGQAELRAMQKEVAVLQVHLTSGAGGGGGGKGAKAPAKTPPKGAAKGGKGGAGAPPPLDEEGALRQIQAVLTGRPDKAVAQAQLMDAVTKVDPNPDGSAKAANLHAVGRAAWAAAVLGLDEVAEKWASRAAAAQELSPRKWSEMARVLLDMRALGDQAYTLQRPAVVASIKALEALEDIVTSFMRLKDVEGIHEASRTIWNTGLVLLQPETRRHVKRAFNSATKALEVIASPLHRLRAQLHLEAAKCDVAEESLIKAASEVRKAYGFDYPAPEAEQQQFQLQRPLDRWIEPLATALELRTSLSDKPASPEEEALTLIERSRESRNPTIKRDLLTRAIAKLAALPLIMPPKSSLQGQERAGPQVSCRKRTCLWGDLVRSAWSASSHMDDIVLAAAPYALAATWSGDQDPEMVVLQASVSYIESEASVAALKRARQEVVPPLQEVAPLLDEESGMRLPATTHEQMQQTVVSAIHRGMMNGVSIKEAWLVINGAVLAWNTYLPIMRAHRYCELGRVLQPCLELLLQLDPADSDGALVCGMAEAYAKSVEHTLLLTLLKPPRDEDDDEEVELQGFRHGVSPGYQPLPSARVKASGMDPKAKPEVADLLANRLPHAVALCEKALARAGTAQSQSLFEAYARLQQLLGRAVAIPQGTSATSEASSKVVSMVEALARPGITPQQAQAEIKAAADILAAMPLVNIELWAKLARAAGTAGQWAQAYDCAQRAMGALPPGADLTRLEPADHPELLPTAWFWLGTAQCVAGQAVQALVSSGGQDTLTQLSLRRGALEHWLAAARCAGFTHKADMAESVARLVWNACRPFMVKPLLRCALVGPLGQVTAVANTLGCEDRAFQVSLNCLYLECLASARKWQEGVAAADAGCRALPDKLQHRPLLAWKAVCLARGAKTPLNEMGKVKEYYPEFQGHTWAVLSHHSAARFDKAYALDQGIQALRAQGWHRAEAMVEYAEWLLSSGAQEPEVAEDVLLSAVDVLLEYDVGEEGEEEDEEDGGAPRGSGGLLVKKDPNRVMLATKDDGKKKKKKKKKTLGGKDLPYNPNDKPDHLGTLLLDRIMRIYTMLSYTANTAEDNNDYMITAEHYASRMLSSAIISAYKARAKAEKEARETATQQQQQAAAAAAGVPPAPATPSPAAPSKWVVPKLPETLQDWVEFRLTPEMIEVMSSDSSDLALSRSTLPAPELTLAYLDLLASSLMQRGYHPHCFPLLHLQVAIAKLVVKSESLASALSLGLVSLLDRLGLSRHASQEEEALGEYWALGAEEMAQAQEQRRLHDCVQAAAEQLAGRPRSALAVGRLSMLGQSFSKGPGSRRVSSSGGPMVPGSSGTAGLEDPAPSATPPPQWLQEAARLQGSELGSAGLLANVRGQLLLRPLTLHDAWLRKGQHLLQRGHYERAKALLTHARDHARACDNSEAEARCLLLLAHCEGLANHFDKAIHLLQAAQRLGGDVEFWRDSITSYVKFRLAMPSTSTSDAREALQGGIAMFTALARDDRAAEKAASAAGAALKTALSQLLLHDMLNLRMQGVVTWKKNYDQAVQLVQQSIAALAARAAGVPHIEALLHQAELLQNDPAPVNDVRPRLKKVLKIVEQAEEMAARFHTAACLRDMDASISPPMARLLARTRLALADLHLAVAQARDRHRKEDRDKARPKFPKRSGQDPSIIVDFIDAMEEAAEPSGLLPEDTALVLAGSAAQLAPTPKEHASALLLAGRCLAYKYLSTVPQAHHPWPRPPPPEPRSPSPVDGAFQVTVTGGSPRHSMTGQAPRASTTGEAPRQSTTGEPGRLPPGAEPQAGDPSAPPADEAVAEDPAVAEALATALGFLGQAEASLTKALASAMGLQEWDVAERAALQLVQVYGKAQPDLAAHYLCLAQSCRSCKDLSGLLISAAPAQQPEALALKQQQLLAQALPQAQQSSHYQQVQEVLQKVGVSTARMVLPASPAPGAQLAALPPDLRLLALHVAPDKQTLYVAALNIPDTSKAPLEEPAVKKDPKKKDAPPTASGLPRLALLESLPLDWAALEEVRNQLRSYRRGAERTMRDRMAASQAKAQAAAAAAAAAGGTADGAGGGERKASARGTSGPGRGGKSSAAGTKRAGSAASGAAAADSEQQQPLFPPELNQDWAEALAQTQALLAPAMQLIQAALPSVKASSVEEAAGGAGAGGPGKKAPTPTPKKGPDDEPPRHKVALLLDPALATLPWEALPWLRDNCAAVSRCPSLHMLHATCTAAAAQDCSLDLSRLTYLVDPKAENSDPQTAALGRYNRPIIPVFQQTLLAQSAFKDWGGLVGQAQRVPSEAEFVGLLAGAGRLLYLGMGRLLAYVPAKVVASVDLRGCDVALIFDRVNNEATQQRQMYLDNRKGAAERALEAPARTAELLLLRGVKVVVVTQAAATPSVQLELLTGVVERLQGGATVAEAVWSSLQSLQFELDHMRSNLIVLGAPHMVAGGAKGKKK